MVLRTKLLLILSTIVVGVAVLASTIIYNSACNELERAAEKQLTEDVKLLSELVQRRFEAELRNFEYWAASPLVLQVALNQDDPKPVDGFKNFFSFIVNREPYTSIYLINPEGDLIACDDPRRLHMAYARDVVSKRPGALAAFSGKANIGQSYLAASTGRPIVTVTAPVWHEGQVEAILRMSIDMERLREELLKPLNIKNEKKFFIFDPSISETLPQGQELLVPVDWTPYKPPPEPLRHAFDSALNPVFHYNEQNDEYLAASTTMKHPPWVFFVSQPISDILAPIRSLRNITVLVIVATLGILIGAILLLTAPTVRGIERCREFSANIRRGRLDHRLHIKSGDEVGLLARDLNEMAAQIQLNLRSIEDAERKYREIFENAVEGIFQTDEAGLILVANPRFAAILGAASPDQVIGRNALEFYGDKSQRDELLMELKAASEYHNFECEIRRMDGSLRQGLLHIRAKRNSEGQISVIHGILEDITERRQAEEQVNRAQKAEELLVRTELEMLRYQINPHFLFNALNSLRELVISAPEDAMGMIESLAEFCRASLVNRREELSTVGDELAHAEHYLQIEKIRFGERLQMEIKAEERLIPVAIPALIILPLVENAVKYGRKSKADPLRIQIHVSLENDFCVIAVANTGRWFEPGETDDSAGTRLGIENVQRRLSHYHGRESELAFEDKDGWVTFKARFPSKVPRPDQKTITNLNKRKPA